jgi:hypothetical protein
VAFKKLLEQDACDIPWMVTLQQLAVTLHALADDRDAVRSWASQTVAATRRRLGLDPLASPAFPPGPAGSTS